MRRRPPLAWIWCSEFLRLLWRGEPYYVLPRGQVRPSLFIAGVVTATCRSIRRAPREEDA